MSPICQSPAARLTFASACQHKHVMTQRSANKVAFHLDSEHKGIRYTVLLILLCSFVAAFLLADRIWSAVLPQIQTSAILSCLAAIPASLLLSAVAELVFKRRWHSGRTLTVSQDAIDLDLGDEGGPRIDRSQPYRTLWWALPLAGFARGGRERRIPSRWFCFAGQVQQNGQRIVVFSYTSPRRANEWLQSYAFTRLNAEEVYNTSMRARRGMPARPELPPEVVAGANGHYWLAERNRWREGVEMVQDDFEHFLQMIHMPNE